MQSSDLTSKNLSFYFLKKLVLSDRSKSLVRKISILSFLAITISVAVFFIVLFVMNGMNKNIRSRILALDPNIIASVSDFENIKMKGSVFQMNEIEKSLQFDSYDLIIRTVDGQFRGTQVTGYDESGLQFWNQKLKDLKNKEKNHFAGVYDADLILSESEVAIGIDLARSLQLLEGDQVTLIPAETLLLSQMEAPTVEKVTIKKILTTDLYDLDSKILLFNRNLSLRRFESGLSRISGFHIWSKKSEDIELIKNQLSKNPLLSRVETWQEKNSRIT